MPISSDISWVRNKFPNICENYSKVGEPAGYNCVAFAADDYLRWWWPSPDFYWPPSIPRQETVDSFVKCFQTLNYVPCGLNEKQENGTEKIAIFVDENGTPTHVSKQLPSENGMWRSKLNHLDCIRHTLGGISGIFEGMKYANYGNIAIILKRTQSILLVKT
jgi:hypothetical protein